MRGRALFIIIPAAVVVVIGGILLSLQLGANLGSFGDSISGFTGIGNAGGEWTLKMETTAQMSGSNGSVGEGRMNGELTFNLSESSTIDKKGTFFESGSLVGPNGHLSYNCTGGSMNIKGKARGRTLHFTESYNIGVCSGPVTIGNITQIITQAEWQTPIVSVVTMPLKDGQTWERDTNALGENYHEKWTLTGGCKEKIPELKSQVGQILSAAISANETPAATHDKLTALANQNFPVGKSFDDNGQCVKVTGFSVDLMYKKPSDENNIFKTTGSTNGSSHRIIDATVDQMSSAAQTYYRGTIDVSLSE